MAFSPMFKLPFVVGGAGLGVIPAADMKPMFAPAPEVDAQAHWDLGGSAASLVDILSGRQLTLAGAAPTYDALGVKFANGGRNGLISDINDKASNFTYAAVIQLDPSATPGGSESGSMFFGTMQASGSSDGNGGGTYASIGSTALSVQNNERNAGASQQFSAVMTGVVAGTSWAFVLMSMAADGTRFIYQPYAGTPFATASAITKTASTRKVSLGNGYYNSAGWQSGIKASEFIVWDRALTQAEAQAVFGRTKERMAYKKGIALLGG
jgi:hypothetical protein